MGWLPKDDWAIETTLSVRELKQGLESRIGRSLVLWDFGGTPFRGRVGRESFEARLSPYLALQSRASPRLLGEFDPHSEGTTIHMRLRTGDFVRVFLGIWFGLAVSFLFMALYIAIKQGSFLPLIFTLLLLCGGMVVVRILLGPEPERSRHAFEETIREIEEEACPPT